MFLVYLVFGSAFGFILSQSGATRYDYIANMFLLRDLHLAGVIGVAIAVAGVGLLLFEKLRVRDLWGQPAQVARKPRHAGNLWGGLVFGAGWALTGTCPGTALSQVGELQLTGLFTIGGIFLGTALYRRVGHRVLGWLERSRRGGHLPGPGASEAA